MAPVALNVVCFRFRAQGAGATALDRLNEGIVADLQESGVAVPSTTILAGRTAIRVCLTNHRTTQGDLDVLLDAVVRSGERAAAGIPGRRQRAPADASRIPRPPSSGSTCCAASLRRPRIS